MHLRRTTQAAQETSFPYLEKYLNPLQVFSFQGCQQKIRPHSRLYGRLCKTRHFVFNAYPGRNATCPLSSCSNKNDSHAVAITIILPLLVKEPFVQKFQPVLRSLHLRRHFFHFLTAPCFGALNLPEVNQFTENCFRMVRIGLKITFLKLRYPKGVTGRLPLCPTQALVKR